MSRDLLPQFSIFYSTPCVPLVHKHFWKWFWLHPKISVYKNSAELMIHRNRKIVNKKKEFKKILIYLKISLHLHIFKQVILTPRCQWHHLIKLNGVRVVNDLADTLSPQVNNNGNYFAYIFANFCLFVFIEARVKFWQH